VDRAGDTKAAMWAAGKVDDRVRQGLVKVTNGQLSAGPAAIMMSADPTAGLKLDLAAAMASPADAKALESFAKANLGMLGMAAQARASPSSSTRSRSGPQETSCGSMSTSTWTRSIS